MENRGLFVTGTDTEVGKTFVACQLLRILRQRGHQVAAYKPVASGGEIENARTDPSQLVEAAGLALTQANLNLVCPQFFHAALAPPVAAELEGKHVDEELLTAGLERWFDSPHAWQAMVVEGAGGLLSPVSASRTVLDVATAIGYPVAVVAANRLGVVNHTLLTLAQLRSASLDVVAVVLNTVSSDGDSARDDASSSSNRELLERFTDTPVVESAEALCDLAFPCKIA
ncbi:MAG: dethiobiotin synthase [Aureliella sp.]